MKFEITVKHNRENTDKAIEIIDNLKAMARARNFDMSNELDIHIDMSENDTIEIIPVVNLLKDEMLSPKSGEFMSDYLLAYANKEELFVDFLDIRYR